MVEGEEERIGWERSTVLIEIGQGGESNGGKTVLIERFEMLPEQRPIDMGAVAPLRHMVVGEDNDARIVYGGWQDRGGLRDLPVKPEITPPDEKKREEEEDPPGDPVLSERDR